MNWHSVQALPPSGWVTLGESLNFSEHQSLDTGIGLENL